MKTLCILMFTLLARSPAQAQEKFVLLVPGFFNLPDQSLDLVPHYFSNTILQTLRARGLTPIVIDNLDPIGGLAENGRTLEQDIRQLSAEHPGASFDVIGHSAGGLYTAVALTHSPDLPIRQVITLSTPYGGVALIDLLKWIPGYQTITNLLNLASLHEFESRNMGGLLAQMKIPARVKWTALAAEQPTCGVISCAEADHQSWLLSLAWRFSEEDGDGVVSVGSAQGLSSGFTFNTWSGYRIPLEHWEVVLDSNWFIGLGVIDSEWIDRNQREVFARIADQLNAN